MIPNIPNIKFKDAPFFLIVGPCVVEDRDTTYEVAQYLNDIRHEFELPVIFKASYRKDNRTQGSAFQGIGDNIALETLEAIGRDFEIPITTDFHTPYEIERYFPIVDVIQIPAFLSRQTSMLEAAGKTGKWVNIKKGQFMSVDDAMFAAEKVLIASSTEDVMITERGTTFGYNDLVVDLRNIITLKSVDYMTVLDITHSLGKEDGSVEMMLGIAKAALAVGVDGIFIEVHLCPNKAKSDGKRMLKLNRLEWFLNELSAWKSEK